MDPIPSDVAFTDDVKAWQDKLGSRAHHANRPWLDRITPELAKYIAQRDSFYMATVSTDGHPYIQHRGGPPGFLKVLDERTLGFADFAGNRQYVTAGNLDGNNRVHLFLTDYASQSRIKIWGQARMIADDPELAARLTVPGYRGRVERAVVIKIAAWDPNCPQHIPELHSAATIRQVAEKLSARIAQLEAENAELKDWLGKS